MQRGYRDEVLEPVGPLPASVYWRRRAIAVGLVLLLFLLLWAIWPGGDGGQPRNAAAVGPTPSATPAELTATQPADDPGRAPEPSTAGATTGTGGPTSPAPRPSATTAAPKPAAPKPCGDKAIAVRVKPERPAYAVGTKPVIVLTVRNISRVTCTRDLGVALQEVLLYRGTERVWSSNDCYTEEGRDVRALRPNQAVSSSVEWSGKLSRPECAGERTYVGAGSYALVGRLGKVSSPRAPITLR